jgi:hypothetical protein
MSFEIDMNILIIQMQPSTSLSPENFAFFEVRELSHDFPRSNSHKTNNKNKTSEYGGVKHM